MIRTSPSSSSSSLGASRRRTSRSRSRSRSGTESSTSRSHERRSPKRRPDNSARSRSQNFGFFCRHRSRNVEGSHASACSCTKHSRRHVVSCHGKSHRSRACCVTARFEGGNNSPQLDRKKRCSHGNPLSSSRKAFFGSRWDSHSACFLNDFTKGAADANEVYYQKTRSKHSCSRKQHHHHCHHFEQPNVSPTVLDCTSNPCREGSSSLHVDQNSNDCLVTDRGSEQLPFRSTTEEVTQAPHQRHNSVGDASLICKSEGEHNQSVHVDDVALSAELDSKHVITEVQAKYWPVLSLNLAKPQLLQVQNLCREDFKIGLPEHAPAAVAAKFDLNSGAEAPEGIMGIPTSCSSEFPEFQHSFFPPQRPLQSQAEGQECRNSDLHCNDRGGNNVSAAIVLDDTSDEVLEGETKDTGLERFLCAGHHSSEYEVSLVTSSIEKRHKYCTLEIDGKAKANEGDMPRTDVAAWNGVEAPYDGNECGRFSSSEKGKETLDPIYEDGSIARIAKEVVGSFKARKKRIINWDLLLLSEPTESEDQTMESNDTMIVEKAVLNKMIESKPHMWNSHLLCDLCHRGPSLSLGEWYAWCCESRLFSCSCSLKHQLKLKSKLCWKKSSKHRNWNWTGVAHKMCALWSCEVFEGESKLNGLWDAIRRGKTLTCSECRDFGATLGCRVKTCRRNFHYPCAEQLASQLRCRMWDGVQVPIACHHHCHVPEPCQNAKPKLPDLKEWSSRGSISRRNHSSVTKSIQNNKSGSLSSSSCKRGGQELAQRPIEYGQSMQSSRKSGSVIDLSSDTYTESEGYQSEGISEGVSEAISEDSPSWNEGDSRHDDMMCDLHYTGRRLISQDISGGREAVAIPCTNDVDSDPAPYLKYITESRYLGGAKIILDSFIMDGTHLASHCGGCNTTDIDDPHDDVSIHVSLKGGHRDTDTRIDWQGQPMFGRLPYDRFSRLLVGPETSIVVECNSRCPCGWNCHNRELQKGLRTPLEVFKRENQGWGIRSMERIARGMFVVEYVGEFMTRAEARESGLTTGLMSFRCLFGMDELVSFEEELVMDVHHMSNVARFITHSPQGNLKLYRVYTETTDPRFFRIGMYAARDIEVGEELSYACIIVMNG